MKTEVYTQCRVDTGRETRRNLKSRLKEEIWTDKNGNSKESPMTQHMLSTTHVSNFNQSKLLAIVDWPRKVHAAIKVFTFYII